MNRSLRKLSITMLVLVQALAAGGCASFAGNNLLRKQASWKMAATQKTDITYTVEWHTMGRLNPRVSNIFANDVKRVFRQSGLFNKISREDCDTGNHLRLAMRNEGNMAVAKLSGFFCGLTFGILPSYANDAYILEATLYQDGKETGTYAYEDDMTTWMQLFMVFAMNNSTNTQNVSQQLRYNMLANLLCEIKPKLCSPGGR